MNPLHLLWIIPLAVIVGMVLCYAVMYYVFIKTFRPW